MVACMFTTALADLLRLSYYCVVVAQFDHSLMNLDSYIFF